MLTENQLASMREIVLSQFLASKGDENRRRAEKFIADRSITAALYPDVSLDGKNVWGNRDARSHERFLNGFLFFSDWYGTILEDPNSKKNSCVAATEIVRSWAAANKNPNEAARMAFHDETTAQRLISLLQLDKYVSESLPEESNGLLRPLMSQTAELLADADFHSAGNNHGMFQDLALLYFSVLADWAPQENRDAYMHLAFKRLREYFVSCFTSEGVHIENTPQYHVMVSRYLAVVKNLVEISGHSDAAYYSALLKKAETYATHALMPNGLYPPISDTTQRPVKSAATLDIFGSPEFLYAASAGRSGTKPTENVLVLEESGYLIYRSRWGDPNATYVFFSAAYNADYHKHSDDLSLYVRRNNVALLAESGPYSYDYKNPLSRYAYSQFAHNSLVVDGRSLPRTDPKKDSVTLTAKSQTPTKVEVEGTNARYDDTVHKRRLLVEDADSSQVITVSDTITSSGDHEYQLLWNLGTEVTSIVHGQGFELFSKGKKVMELTFESDVATSISVHKGQMKPRPLGWTFPRFGEAVPSEVIAVNFSGAYAEVRSTVRFSDWFYADRKITPQQGWKRFQGHVPINYLYCPPADGAARKLVVVFTAIHKPGDFTYNYKATLDEVDVAALYILDDFGDQGAYYYSDHRSTNIFESVQGLITETLNRLDLSVSDVATAGSSKGGAGALIHGLALGVDQIIVGAPQTRIGTFLSTPHPNILAFMAGGTSEEDVKYLDSVIPGLMRDASDTTRILVVVGDSDHHYKYHVKPMISDAESCGMNLSTLVVPGVTHADIGKIFSQYLRANLEQWIRESAETALPYELTIDNKNRSLTIKSYVSDNSVQLYRLYLGSEVVRTQRYSSSNTASFNNLAPGRYRIRVYTLIDGEDSSTAFTTRWATLR